MTMIIDGSNGLTYPNSTVQASAGVVLQVVSATNTTNTSTSSTSYVATNLTASITPKFSTSKILVNVNGGLYGAAIATIYRNSTDICVTGQGFMVISGGSNQNSVSTSYLDSPATTSATAYTVYLKAVSSTPYWNLSSSQCTITLMEIAG